MKDVIRVGTFVKNADGIEFDVTPQTLSHWVDQFKAMRSAGVKVPVPVHLHVDPAGEEKLRSGESAGKTENGGWVEDLFVEGDRLNAVVELIGQDAINAAARNDASINSPPEYVDGSGNRYERPISHIAITPKPVIPGLGEWIPLAASHGATVMKNFLKTVATALSLTLDDSASEDVLSQQVADSIGKLAKGKSEAEARVAALETDLAEAKKSVSASGDKTTPAPRDPLTIRLLGENRTMKLDGLVKAGKITKAVFEHLRSAFVGEDNKALTASLAHDPNGSVFDLLVKSHELNDPVALKELSPGQTIVLADPNADSNEPSGLEKKMEARAAAAKK